MRSSVCTVELISIHALREEGDVTTLNYPRIIVKFLSTPSARRATTRRDVSQLPQGISIHALREEGDQPTADDFNGVLISIHALREEGDSVSHSRKACCSISIHALREEGDVLLSADLAMLTYFYPRPPRGGRHRRAGSVRGMAVFLSTPSARRATTIQHSVHPLSQISIHALREEGDGCSISCMAGSGISIHALREEGDVHEDHRGDCVQLFLSTPSARRATGEKPISHPA